MPYWRLSGYYFFYFAFIGAFSPYFGLYLESLSFSAWDISLLMSQMQLMRLCAPYLWGALADRLGQRMPVIRLAACLSMAVFFVVFPAKTFPVMLFAMALLAFFWSAALPLVESVTFDHLRERRGHYSHVRLWGSVGFIAAVMATGAVLDQLPLSGMLWVISTLLGGIALCALLVPEAPRHGSQTDTRPIRTIFCQHPVKALFAACFSMSAAHGALYVFFSIHLAAHEYSTLMVGSLWSLGVVAEIAIFLVMGQLSRRFGPRRIVLASFTAAIARFLLIGWGIECVPLIIIAQLMHGLTFGAYHAAAIATVNAWFPGPFQARGQALYSTVSFGAGGLLGGVLSGATWEAWGAAPTYTLSSLFALIGFVILWGATKADDFDH